MNQPMNKERKQFMKTCKPVLFAAMTLFATLAIMVQTSAQSQMITSHATAKSKIITFNAPGAGTGRGQGTFAGAVNLLGWIVGNYKDSTNRSHGFLRAANGNIKTIDPTGSHDTFPGGFNCGARSWETTLTRAGFITASCALLTELSPRSTTRTRAKAGAKAPTAATSITIQGDRGKLH